MTLCRALFTPTVDFANHVLRGVGQVMLQDNRVTGFLFLVGIFISDSASGLYALLGTVVSTGAAMLLSASPREVQRGLYGFNGTLIGLGLASQHQHGVILVIYIVLAAIFVTIVMAALMRIFGAPGYVLTGPFVITTWLFIGAMQLSSETVAPHAVITNAQLTTTDALIGILNGPAQVMLQQNVWTGIVFLVAIAVNSRIACAAAVLGSAVGVAISSGLLGAAPMEIRAGLYSFDGVLTAVALGGICFRLHRTTALLAIFAACVSTIIYGSFSVILKPLGLPVLTAPFVVTTWLCLLAAAALPRLQALSTVEGDADTAGKSKGDASSHR